MRWDQKNYLMSSLALLQNYSDSEDDDRSSDEERGRKKRRPNDETIEEPNRNKEYDLNEESDDDKFDLRESKDQSSSNSLIDSPELTPSLKQMKLDKSNEPTKQQTNSQGKF